MERLYVRRFRTWNRPEKIKQTKRANARFAMALLKSQSVLLMRLSLTIWQF